MTYKADGVHAMVPRETMCESARKLRDTYARTPGIPLFKREFGFYFQALGLKPSPLGE